MKKANIKTYKTDNFTKQTQFSFDELMKSIFN